MNSHQPLHLAAAVNDIPFIDAALVDTQHFFGTLEAESHEESQHHGNVGVGSVHQSAQPTQEEIDAVIKESLLKAEQQSRAEAEQAAAALEDGVSPNENFAHHQLQDEADEQKLHGDGVSQLPPIGHQHMLGSESNPIMDPPVCSAPFQRPIRSHETTPSPVYYTFIDRAMFDVWLEGESSWCHYVQRRSTTPDKRSAERLQTRLAKYEKKLEAMSPEERARAAPLKTRRRNRVSPVAAKVTYTCHHAGTYSSQHSNNLPKEKLRMNTKRSVKCACPSRIVLSEMQTGDCRVCYYWKHEGHDPYSENDRDGGRLNKAVDEWMICQIHAGKTPDEIRRALDMNDDEKRAYLEKVAIDPSSVNPNLPPPIALARETKYKYSEIYNRYRKLKGPIKNSRSVKSIDFVSNVVVSASRRGKGKRKASEFLEGEFGSSLESCVHDKQSEPAVKKGTIERHRAISLTNHGLDETFSIDPALADRPGQSASTIPSSASEALIDEHLGLEADADNPLPPQAEPEPEARHNSHPNGSVSSSALSTLPPSTTTLHHATGEGDYASLTATHESLARALLALPGGGGLRDEEIAGMSLEEAMRRLTGDL
ncbi:hypothetical protein L204_100065 [Cryptococcus depauperatus]|nr:hypothetical protein L204_02453 [Cryptococcus depauperatus CBS 7855]